MSRTKKGAKSWAHEYWGRRGAGLHGGPAFRGNKPQSAKRVTHRIERQEGRRQSREGDS